MPAPGDLLLAKWKALVERVVKLHVAYRAAISIGVMAGLYALMMAGTVNACFINLIVPLVLLAFLWKLKVQDIKQLLLFGLIGAVAISGVHTDLATRYYLELPAQHAESDDGKLTDGMVTPLYGDTQTMFNFTLTVNIPRNSTDVENVTLLVGEIKAYGGTGGNHSMILLPSDGDDNVTKYYYTTTLSYPVSMFIFAANISDEWVFALNQEPDPRSQVQSYLVEGPVTGDYGDIAPVMLGFGLFAGFVSMFIVYAILILMVWWLRRARKMRMEAFEKAVAERDKEQEGVSKEEAKVPSLSKAIGKEGDESFVCSECGADVPADAKTCPKCGEKFD